VAGGEGVNWSLALGAGYVKPLLTKVKLHLFYGFHTCRPACNPMYPDDQNRTAVICSANYCT